MWSLCKLQNALLYKYHYHHHHYDYHHLQKQDLVSLKNNKPYNNDGNNVIAAFSQTHNYSASLCPQNIAFLS